MLISIDEKLIKKLKIEAERSERKRVTHRFHKKYSEKVQRMLNVMCRGTYARPHAHVKPQKVEVFIVLEGRVVVVEFTKTGKVRNFNVLDAKKGNFGVEISQNSIHSVIPLSKIAVLYEIKEGPYSKKNDKTFAKFAPIEEDNTSGQDFNDKVLSQIKLNER
jgi:cupin fold WbuC family metalloprotein